MTPRGRRAAVEAFRSLDPPHRVFFVAGRDAPAENGTTGLPTETLSSLTLPKKHSAFDEGQNTFHCRLPKECPLAGAPPESGQQLLLP
jgi:hypothetical protein